MKLILVHGALVDGPPSAERVLLAQLRLLRAHYLENSARRQPDFTDVQTFRLPLIEAERSFAWSLRCVFPGRMPEWGADVDSQLFRLVAMELLDLIAAGESGELDWQNAFETDSAKAAELVGELALSTSIELTTFSVETLASVCVGLRETCERGPEVTADLCQAKDESELLALLLRDSLVSDSLTEKPDFNAAIAFLGERMLRTRTAAEVAITALRDHGGHLSVASTLLWARRGVSEMLSMYWAELMAFRERRTLPGQQSLECIEEALKHAIATAREPTVIIGHGVGAILGYQVLNSVSEEHRVKAFVTVSTPLALWAELGFLPVDASCAPVPGTTKLTGPRAAESWYNLLDGRDLCGFNCGAVFSHAEDLVLTSIGTIHGSRTSPLTSHRFFKRLRERLVLSAYPGSDDGDLLPSRSSQRGSGPMDSRDEPPHGSVGANLE